MPPTALIIGASSGIGLEIARQLSRRGFRLALAARRLPLLESHAASDSNIVHVEALDIAASDAVEKFTRLAHALGTVDYVYLSSGTGFINPSLEWPLEDETIRTNVHGFARLATAALHLFESQGHGHLIGLTSIAALRGSAGAPAYAATKAFQCRYLQALRLRAKESSLPIFVTDVRPGFVDTAMMKADKPFWVATPEKAADQIIAAADRCKPIAYITRRWTLLAWLLKFLPE